MSAIKKRKVPTIHSSNHAIHEHKEQVVHKRKRGLARRLTAFGMIAGMISYFLISTLMGQADEVASKQIEKEKVEKQLAVLKHKEKVLKEDIAKLNDDEYLAKLARRDFFLSDENEIIFSIPEKKEDSSSY